MFQSDILGEVESSEKCAICLQLIERQELGKPLTCRRVFCSSCIIEWYNKRSICPLDRGFMFSINIYENKSSTQVKTQVLRCPSCRLGGRMEYLVLCNGCNCRTHISCGGSILRKHMRTPFHGNYLCLKCIKGRSSSAMVPLTEVQWSLPGSSCGEDKSSETCAICSILIKDQKVGKLDCCGHWFCASCITEWSDKSNICPLDSKTFAIIIIYEKLDGFLEHWYCKCQLCRDNKFQPCSYCKSTVEHECAFWFKGISKHLYLCANCEQRGHRAAVRAALLLRIKQFRKNKASGTNTQGIEVDTNNQESDNLAESSLSFSTNEIEMKNKVQEKNQKINHQLNSQVLKMEEKKKETKNSEEENVRPNSLHRSRSPIRWIPTSPKPDLVNDDVTTSSSFSRFQSFRRQRPQIRRKYRRKSPSERIRRTVLRTNDGNLKIFVNFRDGRSRLPSSLNIL